MLNELFKDVDHRMHMSVEHVRHEFTGLRSARASVTLVEHIKVPYYGNPTPLNQVANLSVPEPRLIVVQPWDKSLMAEIEKAIMASNVGLTPANNGEIIRLNIPPLTEERRLVLVKQVKNEGENARVSVRNSRRDANEEYKQMQKDGLSEDEAKTAEDQIQKLTDDFTEKVEKIVASKEEDIMTI